MVDVSAKALLFMVAIDIALTVLILFLVWAVKQYR